MEMQIAKLFVHYSANGVNSSQMFPSHPLSMIRSLTIYIYIYILPEIENCMLGPENLTLWAQVSWRVEIYATCQPLTRRLEVAWNCTARHNTSGVNLAEVSRVFPMQSSQDWKLIKPELIVSWRLMVLSAKVRRDEQLKWEVMTDSWRW